MVSKLPGARKPGLLLLLCLVYGLSFLSCVSHLREAKTFYAQGERLSRDYQTEKAVSSFKKALSEAALEVKRHPSAQAYLLKGMTETSLEMWKEAEESFLNALSYGYEKGEEWAREVSLLGLASTLEKFGIEDSVLEIYRQLLETSKARQVSVAAAQKYTDILLERALEKEGKEREKILEKALEASEKLAGRDFSCGFYHYLKSQVLSHLQDFRRSFEEAVMARELGLQSEKLFRDNDLQIVFCYQKLRQALSGKAWEDFNTAYRKWVEKWKWPGPETPDWKRID